MANHQQPIAQLPPAFRWPGSGPGPATDYIDMELVIREIDQGLRAQVIAAKFENVAAVHRTLADGASKIAGILRGGARG